MLLWLLRVCYIGLVLVTGAFVFALLNAAEKGGSVGLAVVGLLFVIALGALVMWTDLREKQKDITIISSLFFGLLLGLLVGSLLSYAVEPVLKAASGGLTDYDQGRLLNLSRLLITLITTYSAISLLMQTKDDFRFLIPYVEFSKQIKGGKPLVLDTSVIIDGRIADVCETRLIDTKLVVPRFVLNELQAIADSSDKMKRNRGRRGLDILKRLQNNPKIELTVQDSIGEVKPGEKVRVDERLVLFTKMLGGRVVTNDFNLNKIAQLQGVDVINLNEVSNALKTVALPGEYLQLRIVKAGDQIGQGVGYLDDGTMVVVEQGRGAIGNEVSIVVTSVLQTPAGRMIFGKIEARPSGAMPPVMGASGSHQAIQSSTGHTGNTSTQHKPLMSTETPGPTTPVKPNDAK
jgi:uncharacterized protein YacL